MRLYVSTPILRHVVKKLTELDNRLAETILKADSFIKARPTLALLLGVPQAPLDITPFLHKKLIETTTRDSIRLQNRKFPSKWNSGFESLDSLGLEAKLEDYEKALDALFGKRN